jgi:hypothetical protein
LINKPGALIRMLFVIMDPVDDHAEIKAVDRLANGDVAL